MNCRTSTMRVSGHICYFRQRPCTLTLMTEWIKSAIELRNQLKSIAIRVILKNTGEVVGSTRIQHIDYQRQSCEIGATWFGTKTHRSFVNSDSKFLLLEFCFETLNMMKV